VNRTNTNINVYRPNATGVPLSLDNRSTARWLNTAAFTLQPLYTFGNAARNSIIGPPGFCLDFSAHKEFLLPKEGHTSRSAGKPSIWPTIPRGDCPTPQSAARSSEAFHRRTAPCARCSSRSSTVSDDRHRRKSTCESVPGGYIMPSFRRRRLHLCVPCRSQQPSGETASCEASAFKQQP